MKYNTEEDFVNEYGISFEDALARGLVIDFSEYSLDGWGVAEAIADYLDKDFDDPIFSVVYSNLNPEAIANDWGEYVFVDKDTGFSVLNYLDGIRYIVFYDPLSVDLRDTLFQTVRGDGTEGYRLVEFEEEDVELADNSAVRYLSESEISQLENTGVPLAVIYHYFKDMEKDDEKVWKKALNRKNDMQRIRDLYEWLNLFPRHFWMN